MAETLPPDSRRGDAPPVDRVLPASTYRLQFHRGFTFADARGVAPFLAALGATTIYCSPIFTARPGSTHGYDICRHNEISPELGGQAAFDELVAECRRLGLNLLLDFVPNHMSSDIHTNEWWRDVLENGPSSPFAHFFDIDWDSSKPELKDRLLLPILGEQYGEALERGGLVVEFDRGALTLVYGDHQIPINPRRSPLIFEHGIDRLESALGADSPELREFLSILTSLRNLPPYTERDPQQIAERHREKQVARERLERLAESSPEVRTHIEGSLAEINGSPGRPESFNRLHDLLEMQAYRLASWRTAADEINYRRFFDINDLAGLRVEDPAVFDQIHALLLKLLGDRQAVGVRLDHIDGLFDPGGYLERLAVAARDAVGDGPAPYVVVEKILSPHEVLRRRWRVAGTTGYTFLNDVNGLFVDGRHAKKMHRVYARVTGRQETFADVAYEGKRLIVSTALSSEFQVLTHAVNRISERARRTRDFTLASIRRALREVVACFPAYRSYIDPAGATRADEILVDTAIAEARRRNPALESSIFDFLRSVLVPAPAAPGVEAPDRPRVEVAMRFQQYTAPVQAKGVEDTAFYRYHVLSSLNEVGGDPGRFGRTVAEFHRASVDRLAHWPGEMLATTTHDTKRSEDARARINILSEMPEAWYGAVARWRRLNAVNRVRVDGVQAPDANDEYLFYQALIGAWPGESLNAPLPAQADADLVTRLQAYMHKAVKEAKTHTSWITPNVDYEAAVAGFVERTLAGRTAPVFLASFVPLVRGVSVGGAANSLAQVVLKIASPGVADFYQGTELWDLSLVDPDNRRPVDFTHRMRLLHELAEWLSPIIKPDAGGAADAADRRRSAVVAMLENWPDGRIKLFVTALGLRLRRERPELLLLGTYEPLEADGAEASHVVAFARRHAHDCLIAVVPRLPRQLVRNGVGFPIGRGVWGETALRLPTDLGPGIFRDLFTGTAHEAAVAGSGSAVLPLHRVLEHLPVAVLSFEPS